MERFKNKVVIITGGAGGIGSCTAKLFAKEGALVAVVDISESAAKAVADEIVSEGGVAKEFVCDVTDGDAVDACVKSVAERFKRIDILVCLAGGSARSRRAFFYEQSTKVFENVMKINLYGDFFFARSCAKYMIEQRYGRIINTGSVVGINGHTKHVEYAAAKGGTIAMTKAMAKEVGKFGITVNCVSPGMIPTKNATGGDLSHTNFLETTPSPDDVADAIAFLASDEAKFITGFNLVVDGGRSLGTKGTD